MTNRARNIGGKIVGAAVLALLGVGLSWLAGRFLTCAFGQGGGLSDGIGAIAPLLPGILLVDPLSIDLSNPSIALPCAILLFGPALMGLAGITRGMKLDNEDTGREHGDARFATAREMGALLDKRHPRNNLMFSEHAGIVVHPHDAKTKAASDGKNLNAICIGISGLGKTFNGVMSEINAAVGGALDPLPYGIRNIPSHLAQTSAMRIARAACRLIADLARAAAASKRAPDASGDGVAPALHRQAEAVEQHDEIEADGVSNVSGQADASEIEREAGSGAVGADARKAEAEPDEGRPSAAAAAIARFKADAGIAPRAERKAARAAAKAAINEGFDFVNTDPKGENIANVGNMLLRAGYEVKCINTVDFRQSLRVNPLAYIPERRTDSVPAEQIKVSVSGFVSSRDPERESRRRPGDYSFEPAATMEFEADLSNGTMTTMRLSPSSTMPATVGVEASLLMDTKTVSWEDVPDTDKSAKELAEALASFNFSDAERAQLQAQFERKQLEESLGGFVSSDNSRGKAECSRTLAAIRDFSYRQTGGKLTITVCNNGAQPIGGEVKVDLGRSLEVTGAACASGEASVSIRGPKDTADGSTVIFCRLGGIEACPREAEGPASAPVRVITVPVRIVPMTVPDGVKLTKVVDTIVANLKSADAQAGGSSDPFWEDTKRLFIMSKIAFLFEKYDKKYRTIPEMIRLINMATPEGGEGKSPLEVLMDTWEFGRVFSPADSVEVEGVRGVVRGGSWKPADNPPHSLNASIALYCFHAYYDSAEDTRKSVIITCKTALVPLLADDVQDFLSADEVGLDTLGDPGQKQAIFIVTSDTDSPYDFLTALVVQLAIDLAQERAFKRGGKLARHVRFILDEIANIGRIPVLVRALAVVRSRNISISMYFQSRAQLQKVYGDKECEIIFDNCSTLTFLGAQTKDTLEEISNRIGEETVYSRLYTRSFSDGSRGTSASEQIQATGRRLMSPSQITRMSRGTILVFIFNMRPILDTKFQTQKSPYFAYMMPGSRSWLQHPCVCDPFDYAAHLRAQREERGAAMEVR